MNICEVCKTTMLYVSTSEGGYYSCQNCGNIHLSFSLNKDDDRDFTTPLRSN